jgi:hypothetical protein
LWLQLQLLAKTYSPTCSEISVTRTSNKRRDEVQQFHIYITPSSSD